MPCLGGLTHRCTKTTIDLQHSELIEVLDIALGELRVRHDLVLCGGLDTVPIAVKYVTPPARRAQ